MAKRRKSNTIYKWSGEKTRKNCHWSKLEDIFLMQNRLLATTNIKLLMDVLKRPMTTIQDRLKHLLKVHSLAGVGTCEGNGMVVSQDDNFAIITKQQYDNLYREFVIYKFLAWRMGGEFNMPSDIGIKKEPIGVEEYWDVTMMKLGVDNKEFSKHLKLIQRRNKHMMASYLTLKTKDAQMSQEEMFETGERGMFWKEHTSHLASIVNPAFEKLIADLGKLLMDSDPDNLEPEWTKMSKDALEKAMGSPENFLDFGYTSLGELIQENEARTKN